MSRQRAAVDDLDRRLVERLRADGREGNRSLAKALNVTEPTVVSRLRRLEANDLVHVVALTDIQGMGFDVFALIFIAVDGRPHEAGEEIASMREAISVSVATGRFDLLVGVIARDRHHLVELLDVLAAVEGVDRLRCELAVKLLRYDSQWSALGMGEAGALPVEAATSAPIDSTDLAIIRALQEDARSSNRAIAGRLDVSESTVRTRIRRLEEDRRILIRAVSDAAAFGLQAQAVVGIRVCGGAISSTSQALASLPGIPVLLRSLGEFDFVAIALAHSRAELIDQVLDTIHHIPGIRKTETFEFARNIKHVYTWTNIIDPSPGAVGT